MRSSLACAPCSRHAAWMTSRTRSQVTAAPSRTSPPPSASAARSGAAAAAIPGLRGALRAADALELGPGLDAAAILEEGWIGLAASRKPKPQLSTFRPAGRRSGQ